MYCSSCGVAAAQGLSYCKHCGAKLNGERGEGAGPSELRAELLVCAMAGVFVAGLAAIALLIVVTSAALGEPLAIVVTALSFLIMLLVESVLIWLLLRRTRRAKRKGDGARAAGQFTKELDAEQARALHEPAPSVTEHTTRTFEPIYRERKSE